MPGHCLGRALRYTVEQLPKPGRCSAEIGASNLTQVVSWMIQVVGQTMTEQPLKVGKAIKSAGFTKTYNCEFKSHLPPAEFIIGRQSH